MKKFTPVLILTIFLVGVVWMIFGMKNAMDISDPAKAKRVQVTQENQ
ncbi:MAG: hypothetical protein U9R27_10850 [Campylobacterota bacterium]|nr:hypothetical protein [Campylobacterota bacterium]